LTNFNVSIRNVYIIKLAHKLGYEAAAQTPQVFPSAKLMKPFSPQLADQEFLMTQ